mmetsp:Transcript_56073/g.146189  ORF Transcript_56073/g.146189 Transcript_56073/m.146189 type:complete len:284 (-) Transcript_56073:1197-2048(-)
MHREDSPLAHGLQLADSRTDQPIVPMDDVKAAHAAFDVAELPNEGTAHVLNLPDEVWAGREGDLMIDDSPDWVLPSCPVRGPREDVDFVAGVMQGSGKLCDMRRNTTSCDRVQGLPRQHRNLQWAASHNAILRRLRACKHSLRGARCLGCDCCLDQTLHAPLLIAARLELRSQALRQCRSLTDIEAQPRICHWCAQGWEIRPLLCDCDSGAVQFMHKRICHHEIMDCSIVQHILTCEPLFHCIGLFGHPHAIVGIDHCAHALKSETIETIVLHPEMEACQQVT